MGGPANKIVQKVRKQQPVPWLILKDGMSLGAGSSLIPQKRNPFGLEYPFNLLSPIIGNRTTQAAGSQGAEIFVTAERVSQACDPLNCPAVGTWSPATCL